MKELKQGLDEALKRTKLSERLQDFQDLMAEVLKDPEVKQFLAENKNKLSDEEIKKSFSRLYEFVQEKNKFLAKDPNQIAPGYKPQLILNHHFIDVTYVATKELLDQQKEQEILNRVTSLQMPKDIRQATFEELIYDESRTEAISAAYAFVKDYIDAPFKHHQGLYLSGSFGVGKSYLLGAIAHELALNGYESVLVHFPSFVLSMKEAIGKGTVGKEIDNIKKAPILMLDDLGADTLSSWIRDEVLGVILQYRMQEDLPLFVSSNISLEDLESSYLTVNAKGESEPLKAKRIMERIHYLTKEVPMIGVNRRHI